METIVADNERVTRQDLNACFLLIMGRLNRSVDYLSMGTYLPKSYADLYRDIILGSLSEETTWHYGTAANQYLASADNLGPFIDATKPYGFQLNELGKEAYQELLDEADNPDYPYVHEVLGRIDEIQKATQAA